MQTHALDKKNQLISITFAQKQVDYLCPKCKQGVRLKKGTFRAPHFYHLSSKSCTENKMSDEHNRVQLFLQREIGKEDVLLEHRFEAIGRIADVAWPDKKLIFEVQCSPISKKEVRGRIRDYRKMGYQVIWILHVRTFNNQRLLPAERWLSRHHPHYYTNMDASGNGVIYDQLSIDRGKYRKKKSMRLAIKINHPTTVFLLHPGYLPPFLARILKKRWRRWKVAFRGDLSERAYLPQLQNLRKK